MEENEDRSGASGGQTSGINGVQQQPLSNVRCLVVEDDELQAKMQARLLSQAGASVTVSRTLREGRAALERTGWDLLIVDLGLPDGCGSTIASEALAQSSPPGVVILSGRLDLLERHDLTSPGVVIVSKGAIGHYLVGVATAALATAGRRATDAPPPSSSADRFGEFVSGNRLSKREGQILGLLIDGVSPKEIATSLGIAGATVRYHVRTTFRKCGVKNQREVLALYARKASGMLRSW